jgi:predicted transcriptional regulator
MTEAGCEAIITSPEATITTAATLMRDYHVPTVFVMECPSEAACALIGAVTDRDLVVEVTAMGLDPNVITVGDLVKNGLTGETHERRSRALVHGMRSKGIRQIPIARDGQLEGTVMIEQLLQIVGD